MVDRFNTLVLNLFSRAQLAREEGQGTVEYALVLAAVVGVAAVVTAFITGGLTNAFTSVGTKIGNAVK
jgi:Flp pilus assembly pilin Flp